ncbi:MAG: iron-containing alcohol dehydrogenase [Oscillospiraceae bacterium]|jgi:alcohol dehydrogenase YqhD (iron-dependent ADH family)|nr:iron-containing alcohol dehydrogenase [Oscillospiraceae bacterium]
MENFHFQIPTHLYFGKGEERGIGAYLRPYAKKVLLHYGGGSIKKSGLYAIVTASLRDAGIAFVTLGGVVPNPRLSLVREGIALCRREGVELILAVGGGSAIDSAKAIALGVCYEGDVWALFNDDIVTGKALPVATVLTIPAAGSETSASCVVTNEEAQLKYGHTDNAVRPVLSVINPAYFCTLPKNQIANGVADMMSHIFERYFTQTKHTDVTDELCEGVLRAILKNAVKVYDNPQDVDAWYEIGFGGSLAHNDLLGRGREEDWACHGMEHELSAIYDIPHGAGLAVLTPNWMETVAPENQAIFGQFAHNVMGVQPSRDVEADIREGIARLRAFYRRIGLATTLTALGIDGARLEEMAKKATGAAFGDEYGQGHFKTLLWQDVLAIYRKAL